MKYHTINGEIWKDSEFRSFSLSARLLFLYLYSNKDCPPSGLYKKELEEMAFEMRMPNESLVQAIKEIDGKWIAYDFSKVLSGSRERSSTQ